MRGIGAAVAERLAIDGWDVAITYYAAYDERMPWGSTRATSTRSSSSAVHMGRAPPASRRTSRMSSPRARVFDTVERDLGSVAALVMCHCESVDSDVRTTTVESFDRHYAVNVRRRRCSSASSPSGIGRTAEGEDESSRSRVITRSATSRTARPKAPSTVSCYAAAAELRDLAVTANVVNPGPNDTGWMTDDLRQLLLERTPLGRLGRPTDAADLISFLCSPAGGWINGQLITSDGGISASS